jgi:dipeptidyl aminopeptidase/acylaminoacyl peptidase
VAETFYIFNKGLLQNPIKQKIAQPKPLLTYTFENLKKTKFPSGSITLGAVVSENADSFSRIFYFSVPQKPNSAVMEKVSGLMNIPKKSGNYPVIVMFRGFVPDNIYKPGIGTQPAANVFVSNGFITLAPDFLGYAESASPSADPFENRFQTYTTALSLLASLPNLNSGLETNYLGTISADLNKIGIWGHSNGGHIALSTLEISGVNYPTVLWAPVSASFPYSILYYTDESDDQGKALRQTLAGFEKIYNTDSFSLTNYFNWIKAPIEINQGTSDQEVPVWWSDNLVDILNKDSISTKYYTYPGADHNLLPGGWSEAVLNSIDFYNQQFLK